MPLQVTAEEFRANMERDRYSRTRRRSSGWPTTTRRGARTWSARCGRPRRRTSGWPRTRRRRRSWRRRGADRARRCRPGGTVLVFGNGGSAADAQHFVAELVGRYEQERQGVAGGGAVDRHRASLTAVGNDYGFDRVFARQIEALGQAGRRGARHHARAATRRTCCAALEAANDRGLVTIALDRARRRGRAGSRRSRGACRKTRTPRVQEVHATRAARAVRVGGRRS